MNETPFLYIRYRLPISRSTYQLPPDYLPETDDCNPRGVQSDTTNRLNPLRTGEHRMTAVVFGNREEQQQQQQQQELMFKVIDCLGISFPVFESLANTQLYIILLGYLVYLFFCCGFIPRSVYPLLCRCSCLFCLKGLGTLSLAHAASNLG